MQKSREEMLYDVAVEIKPTTSCFETAQFEQHEMHIEKEIVEITIENLLFYTDDSETVTIEQEIQKYS